jgi:hypothetical protein
MNGNLSKQQFDPGASVTSSGAMPLTRQFEGPSPLGGDQGPASSEGK